MSAPEPTVPAPVIEASDVQDVVTPIRGRHSTALVPVPDQKTGIFGMIGDRRPAIMTSGLPPLEEIWQYGKTGQYTGQKGALRRAGQAYAAFAFALTALGYVYLWVIRRPSRLLVALVLGALFALTIAL